MNNKIDRSGGQPLKIYKELNAIEESLQRPVSPRTCHRLFHKLEATSHSLQGLQAQTVKTTSIFQQSQAQHVNELQDKIVSLYGRAVDRKVDYQVEQIAEETSHLERTLDTANPEELIRGSNLLQKHVRTLLHDHCLSRDKFPVIQRAKQTLDLAKQKLSGESASQPMRHFEWLATQAPQAEFVEEAIEFMPGEVEELFDIALLLHVHDLKQAKSRYNQLPEDTKTRIAKHMSALGGDLFRDENKTAIALVATAYELTGTSDVYLTNEEIQDLFTEATRLIAESERPSTPFDIRFIG